MLKRKIINELLYWKRKTTNKALLIKGARQVGKTTIVRQFAKANYKHFIEINFDKCLRQNKRSMEIWMPVPYL